MPAQPTKKSASGEGSRVRSDSTPRAPHDTSDRRAQFCGHTSPYTASPYSTLLLKKSEAQLNAKTNCEIIDAQSSEQEQKNSVTSPAATRDTPRRSPRSGRRRAEKLGTPQIGRNPTSASVGLVALWISVENDRGHGKYRCHSEVVGGWDKKRGWRRRRRGLLTHCMTAEGKHNALSGTAVTPLLGALGNKLAKAVGCVERSAPKGLARLPASPRMH